MARNPTLGSIVKTPSGKVGVVIKWFTSSNFDMHERVSIAFSCKRSDGVVLRPHLVQILEYSIEKNPTKQYLDERLKQLKKIDDVLEITLPWPPKELNPNARTHWALLAKKKSDYRRTCFYIVKAANIKLVNPNPTIELTFYQPDKRQRDLDNMLASMKSGLDGLADALQVNDKQFFIKLGVSENVGGMVKVKIS